MNIQQTLENHNNTISNINIQVQNISNTVNNLPNFANSYLATANVSDINENKTAYINGAQVVGTYENLYDDITNQYINITNINTKVSNIYSNLDPNKCITSSKPTIHDGIKFQYSSSCDWVYTFDTYAMTDMGQLFIGSTFDKFSVKGGYGGWDISSVITANMMFRSCRNLSNVYLNGWNFFQMRDMSFMFDDCTNLRYIDIIPVYTPNKGFYPKLTDITGMFRGCNNLSNICIINIITNLIVLANQIPTTYRNLSNTFAYSPFSGTNISNTVYQSYWNQLNQLGWSY